MLYYPLSREPGRVSIWYPFPPRGALSQTPASFNTFHTGPIAVPQISCDVTHHSGVFTAYYASKRGSSPSLPFFPKHVWSSKDELFVVAGLQHMCVTGDGLFKHVLLRTHTAKRRGRDRDLNHRRLRKRLRCRRGHPLYTSITPHLQSPMGLLP